MERYARARWRRFVLLAVAAAALIGLVALVTACGSSSSDRTAPAAGQAQARRFAQCVRDNGVPDFPDPDADGRFRGVGHEQQDNPKFRAAQQKCRGKLPGGGEHR